MSINRHQFTKILVLITVFAFLVVLSGLFQVPEAKAAQVNFVAAGTGAAIATTATLTPAFPAGLLANDLILLQVTVRNTIDTPTTPTGFTLLFGPEQAGTLVRQFIYYKISDGTESGNLNVQAPVAVLKLGRMYAFRNNGTSNFNESGGFGSGTDASIEAQSATTTDVQRQAVSFIFVSDDNTQAAFTGETGGDWIEPVAEFVSALGLDGGIGIQTATLTAATTISGGSQTMAAADPWGVRAFAIKPPETTLGDGTNPSNVTIAPGATATDTDAFTFQTTGGTDSITQATTTLSSGSSGGLSKVEITNDAGSVVYGSSTNPTSDTLAIALSGLTANTSSVQFKIRITPKSHANMPAPPGSTYTVTATVTAWIGTIPKVGTDNTSATITIDNQSPANVTDATTTPAGGEVTVSWTNPGDADFSNVVVVRATSTPNTGIPTEGSSPAVNDVIGNGVVRYISSGTSTTDTGLTNGTTYYYKIWAKDTNGNYSSSTIEVNDTPVAAATLTQEHFRWYENIDSATPTTALATLDTVAKGVDNSVPIRLRMNVGVTGAALGAGNAFKLQYSTATSSGWADIGAAGSGTIWRAYDNSTPASGSTLPSLLIASSTVAASYEEGVTSTGTPSTINVNDFGEWDWSIQNNGATAGTTYYFRMIRGNSNPLNSYTRWPSITTPGNAQISAASNQTFYVGQATTTIATTTVTATGTDAITAYGDIRVKIASSSVNMQWDTTDTLATLGGTASGKASTTVSYPDAYTLKIDVTSDFTATDTLDISGLSFTNFNAVNTATSSFRLFRGGPNDSASDASPSQTAAIKGALTLGNHPAGQEGDKFATSTSVTDELLAFQLTPDGENASTTLVIRLSSLTGITTGDLGTFEVIRDDNKDGSLSGESTAFFGSPTATAAGPDIELRFTATTSTVPNGTSTAFILRGTVNNLIAGDAMTVQLPSANITADGQTTALRLNATPNSVGGSLSADGGPHQENAISRTLRSYRWYNDDGSSVNNATAMAGGETPASNVRIGQRLASRFQVDNTGGPEGSGIVYRLQWNTSTSSSGWEDVGANTAISYSFGLSGANNDAITTSTATTSPCCTFTNGTWHENAATSSGGVTLGASKFTELVYMVKTDKASPGTNYYLRLINGTASTTLDATPASALAPLTTTSTANDIRRYSKEAVTSLPTATSHLTYFFDDLDYTNAVTADGTFAPITSSTSAPMMRFSNRNATTSDQINVDWVGKSSVAFSSAPVSLEVYRFGGTNAWLTMASDSATLANTTTTINASVTSNLSEYYEQDGSNFWTHWRVRQASTSATLSTDAPDIKFLGLVTLTSSSSQTLVVGDSATLIATTTVTDSPSSPRIKTANDIRIRIPAGLNLEWDASTTVATLSGSAVSKATSTVSYSGDFKTLIIDVTSDFAANDTLTISGLKYRNFTQASASSSRALRADGAADVTDDATDNQTLTIRGKFDESNHAAGQEPNKFDSDATSLTGAELFAFQLVRTGEDMNAATLTIALSNVSGFASSSITNAKIYIDADGDGTIGAGETTTVGATGTVSITGATGTITFSGTWTATGTRNYILKADVSSIDDGDTLTFGLPTANVNATGATSQVAIPIGGSITNAPHGKPSQARGGQPTGGAAPSVTSVGGGTGAGGGGASGGAPPTSTTTTGGGAGGGGGGAP